VKKTFCSIAVLGAFLFYSQVFALIEGIGLGGISTVAPSNAYDVSRNPALLTNGTSGMTLFGSLQSIAYTNFNLDATVHEYITPKTEKTEEKNDSTYSLSVPLGFTINNGSWATGFLISSGQYPLYKKEKHNRTIYIYNPADTDKDTTKVETTYINPKLEFGFGFKTGQYSSFGITLYNILTKKTESEKHDSVSLTTGLPVGKFEKISKEEKIEFGGIIGFHHTQNRVESGCTINTGTYGFITKEKESINPGLTTKGSTSKKFTLLTSPSVSVGLLYRINTTVDFATELQYTLASKHNEDSIDDGTMAAKKEKQETMYGSSAHMGLRIHISSSITMMTGAGFIIEEQKISSGTSTAETNTYIRLLTGLFSIGAEYKSSDNFTIGLAVLSTYSRLTYDFNAIYADAKYTAKVYECQVITGFSYKI